MTSELIKTIKVKSYIVGATRVKRGKLYIFDASRHSFHKSNPVTQLSFKPVNAIHFFTLQWK